MYPVQLIVPIYNGCIDHGKLIELIVIYEDEEQFDSCNCDSPIQQMLDQKFPGYQIQDFPQFVTVIKDWDSVKNLPIVDLT